MVQVDVTTRVSISVGGGQNTSLSKLQGLLIRQIVLVLGIENTIRECLTRANAEEVARQASTVAVNIVESRAFLLGDTGAHGAHAEAHSLVTVDEVGEDLAGGGNADATLVS